jgi:PilZ domain
MLITKQKREPRRARRQSAWIMFDDDFVSHECQVLDVSLNGAKLVAEIDVAIGSTFKLSTVPHALVRQRCEVVWCRGKMFGVTFVDEVNQPV